MILAVNSRLAKRRTCGFPDEHTLALKMVPGTALNILLPDATKLRIELVQIEGHTAGLYVRAEGLTWEGATVD
ncbi:MAG: hypothetical protein ABIP48_01520 [Planctomycetota bacterium]